MPIAKIRGVNINYEVIGDSGPWMMASPGGRRSLEGVRYLANSFAEKGFRVLIHDRRNCGVSDVSFDDSASEYEIWADDLYELLKQLGGLPAIVGGGSSGCRMALLFALRHPNAARALLMWRVTGGSFAAARLAEAYYGQYISAAQQGGMAAVCALDHFKEMCAANPDNRKRLMETDVKHFIKVMQHWREYFLEGAKLPIIGCTAADLAKVKIPTAVIPGNDLSHPRAVARTAQSLIPGSELFDILGPDLDIDVAPPEQWVEVVDEHVRVMVDFLARHGIKGG